MSYPLTMLSKCPFDHYAYYDQWGNRYLLFSIAELLRAARVVETALLLSLR